MNKSYTLAPSKLRSTKLFSTYGIVIAAVVSFWLFIVAYFSDLDYIHLITSILRAIVSVYRTILIYVYVGGYEDDMTLGDQVEDDTLTFSRGKRWFAFFCLYATIVLFIVQFTKLAWIFLFLTVVGFAVRNDHRWFALFAMVCLLQVIRYLILDKQVSAENRSIYLYYALVATVLTSFINDGLSSPWYKNIYSKVINLFKK